MQAPIIVNTTRPPLSCPPLILIDCQDWPAHNSKLDYATLLWKAWSTLPSKRHSKPSLSLQPSLFTTLCLIPHTLTGPSSCMRILWTHCAVSPSCLCPCWPLYLECFLSHTSPTLNYPCSQAVFTWPHLSPVLPGHSCISVPLHFPSCTLQLYV